jgi:hypothetical protein
MRWSLWQKHTGRSIKPASEIMAKSGTKSDTKPKPVKEVEDTGKKSLQKKQKRAHRRPPRRLTRTMRFRRSRLPISQRRRRRSLIQIPSKSRSRTRGKRRRRTSTRMRPRKKRKRSRRKSIRTMKRRKRRKRMRRIRKKIRSKSSPNGALRLCGARRPSWWVTGRWRGAWGTLIVSRATR